MRRVSAANPNLHSWLAVRVVLCFALLFFAMPLFADELPKSVRQALTRARIPEDAAAIVVESVEGNGFLFSHNGEAPMNPASVMKLVTTHAALELLGPGNTWRTAFWSEVEPDENGLLRGHLYLKGSGDPALTLERFWRLLRQLRARGVRTIAGDLVLDRSAFRVPASDPGAFDKRPLRAYNVAPDALLVDFFALRFILRSEEGGVRFLEETPNDNVRVAANVVLGQGGCDGWRSRLDIRQTPGRLDITGNFPASCGERTLLLSPLSPDAHIDGLFRALWRELGGSLQGKARLGDTPTGSILLAAHDSPQLSEIVRDMNKWSSNVVARQVFLALDDEETLRTEAAAAKRVAGWLLKEGLNFPELVLENGSGLSRQERISADSMSRMLVHAWKGANMPDFLASLPVAAIDGTMQKRLVGTAAAGRARIKTGSLDGVKTAAGYVQDVRGRRYAVTIFINHPNAGAGQGAIDALILQVAEGLLAGQGAGK
ncbi:MAG: D-alanyl-D-alanine carboxypeptidase/D-alanyl-D-alanine-endopeptidase [Betaproteobacteria bacterium]|nr:D-alanyl-D-alanine carboxypeptidase/D-alanyl-D-alanine-endopeptidase [Betaproteobacteria bacterium]